MNINGVFLVIASVLAFVFFYFKPTLILHKDVDVKIPQVEIHNFILYQFDTEKLANITIGKTVLKFPNRYQFYDFHFKDNQNSNLVDLSGMKGSYKDDILSLQKDVVYTTDDGLAFYTQELVYNRKKDIVQNHTDFLAKYKKMHSATGKNLFYDIKRKMFHSQDTTVIYTIGKE